MVDTLRQWIVNIICDHQPLLALALGQRAKFEGWLKFELAQFAVRQGAVDVQIEPSLPGGQGTARSDLSFKFGGSRYCIELKTPTTNSRMPGVKERTRPITRNIDAIVEDCLKHPEAHVQGIVAFAMFPVRPNDENWIEYFDRIVNELGLDLRAKACATRVTVDLPMRNQADIIVATIPISIQL